MTIRRTKQQTVNTRRRMGHVLLALATFMAGTALSQSAFAQVCCHTVRCPECPAGQYINEDIYRVVANSSNCTPYTSSNPNAVLQSRQQVAMSFCSAAPNCDAQAVNWTVGGQNCSGTAGVANDGSNSNVTNTTSGVSGTADFLCTNGNFSFVSGTCNVVASAGCAAQNVSWEQNGHVCYSNVAALVNGGSSAVNDSVAPTTGAATFSCANGILTPQAGATCTGPAVPPTNNCIGTSTNWTVGLNNCASNIPDLAHGSSVTIYDNAAPTTGSAMMTCNNGVYARSAESCVSSSPPVCPPPPPPPSPPVTIYSGCLVDTPWWDVVTSPDCESGFKACTTTDSIVYSIGTHTNAGSDAYYFQAPERYTIVWSGACTGTGNVCVAQDMANGTHVATVTVTDSLTGQVTNRNVTAKKTTVRRVNLNECPEQL